MPKQPKSEPSSTRYIGPLDQSTDLGFWLNVSPDTPLSRLEAIDKLDPHVLHTLDYATADPAELELICKDVTQSPAILHRVLTARVYRLGNPQCILVRVQRRFAVRSELTNAEDYLPISSFLKIIDHYYETLDISAFGRRVLWAPGEHGAVVVWCIGLLLPESRPIGQVLDVAQQHVCDIEEIYASRMVHVDATSPWQSVQHIDRGRWFSRWEKEQLLNLEGIDLLDHLGSGGVSTTWVARKSSSDDKIVVKMLAPDLRFEDINLLRDRFQKEFHIGQQLEDSRCSPRVIFRGCFMGRDYFTMTYHPWPTLRDWVQKESWSVDARQEVMCALIRSVGRMHEAGVIHRDVSPKNILVGPGNEVLLIDFGAATCARQAGPDLLDVTLPGQQFGSLKYSAPELRDSSENGSPACDIFSVGVIVYEVMLRRNIAGNMTSLLDLGVRASRELSEFAFRALSFSAPDRLPATSNFASKS